jgi:hypothetical protein
VKRIRPFAIGLIVLLLVGSSVAQASAANHPVRGLQRESLCEGSRALCVDPFDTIGEYVGHDEPSVLFKSSVPGSGNDITYQVKLPQNPKEKPKNNGSGGTWDFQLSG